MENNFNKIYEEIYKKEIAVLTKLKKQNDIALIMLGVSIFISIYLLLMFNKTQTLVFVIIINIILAIYFFKQNYIYKKVFKKNIIEKIISLYSNNLYYNERTGVNVSEYRYSKFNNDFNIFYSEDLITGTILEKNANIKMSQICLKKKTTRADTNGERKTEIVEVYKGLFGVVTTNKNCLADLDITTNKMLNRFEKSRIEVDSSKFEKYYDFFSKDKIRAMEIFTSEILEELNNCNSKLRLSYRNSCYI